MTKNRRLVFWLTFAGILLIAFIATFYLYLLQKSPLSFEEMDFDQSGYVTFSELIRANSEKIGIDQRENDKNPTDPH